jgi:hypothetical protein
MHALQTIGGRDALLSGFLAVFVAGFAIVFGRLIRAGMGWPLAGGLVAFAMVGAGFHFYVRPHVFTMVFQILVTLLLLDYHRGRVSFRVFLLIIPLHLVWTNLHGGMLGGLFTFGLVLLDWFTSLMRREGRHPTPDWRCFVICLGVFVACCLTMFVNPIGLELQRTWFRLIGSSALAANVDEHKPIDPSRGGDQAVIAFGVLYLVMLAGRRREFAANPIWLIPLVWLVLSISSIRNGPLFVVTALVVLIDLWPNSSIYHSLRRSGDLLATPQTESRWQPLSMVLPFTAVAISLFLQANRVSVPVIGHGWGRNDARFIPDDLAARVRNIPPGSRIYNDANFGGFLIGTAPDLKIFMDDRFELCGDDWLRHYVDVVNHRPDGFDVWQRQYGFGWALLATTDAPDEPTALQRHVDRHPRWHVVARGRIATLYEWK